MNSGSTVGASADGVSGFSTSTLMALVVFAAITPMMLLVAPAVAAQLSLQMGLEPARIGTYFFVESAAISCAALPSMWWLGRLNARTVAVFAVAVFCVGNFATAALMPGFGWLLALRAMTALAGGTLTCRDSRGGRT